MADIDLLIEQPILGETASVQVKSRATQAVLDEHMTPQRRCLMSATKSLFRYGRSLIRFEMIPVPFLGNSAQNRHFWALLAS